MWLPAPIVLARLGASDCDSVGAEFADMSPSGFTRSGVFIRTAKRRLVDGDHPERDSPAENAGQRRGHSQHKVTREKDYHPWSGL